MKARKVTAVEIGEMLGVSQSTVSHWLSDKSPNVPNADDFARIVELCRGSADVILGLTVVPVAPELVAQLADVSDLRAGLRAARSAEAPGKIGQER